MDASSYTSGSSSPRRRGSQAKTPDDLESGYASAMSSTSSSSASLPQIMLTQPHLRHLNDQMERMTPLERIRFSTLLFPSLFQTTAFGLTGLVTVDMLAKLRASDPNLPSVDTIFLDTLYHFAETYELVERVSGRYPEIKLHVFKPDGCDTVQDFEDTYGSGLYDSAGELYDWVAKVEPQQRAYADLNVAAVFTGRRRSQGGARDKMPIIEVDEERGIVKINPLADWSFAQVKAYITDNDVPYNVLLDRGYKSVGDWHSTSPVAAGEDERAGRWKGQDKTECGIHNKKSRYAQFLEEQALKKAQEEREMKEEEEKEQQVKLAEALELVERQQKEAEEEERLKLKLDREARSQGSWIPVI
ncbi:Phosphoadenosine phosphosulfate reductase family-domain-containing protein [Xylariaceae sp. FL0255]|nr:Phosphoadenosine phosphosulfate reductase family-domain-containing protein [Xylariaceae sp. FL0255]